MSILATSSVIMVLSFCEKPLPLTQGKGGDEQKNAPKNRFPLTQGTIELSVNVFPTQRGKRLQFERLDLDSRVIGL